MSCSFKLWREKKQSIQQNSMENSLKHCNVGFYFLYFLHRGILTSSYSFCICVSLFPLPKMLENWKANSFSPCVSTSEWLLFKGSSTWIRTFWKLFWFHIFFPCLGSSSLIARQPFCSSYLSSDCSPFAHLNWSSLVFAWDFGSSSSKESPLEVTCSDIFLS